MPAGICLPPSIHAKLSSAIEADKLAPDKLSRMTSDERHSAIADIVGDGNAKFINSQFESKMLLKNQKAGYARWAASMSNVKPAVRATLESKIAKLDHVLDPAEEKDFLKDLASTKLGVNVSSKEAKEIANLSKSLTEATINRDADGTFKNMDDRLAYGRAHFDLSQRLQDMKEEATKQPLLSNAKHPISMLKGAANLSRSFKTVGDLSIAFRNGFKMLTTHPTIWAKSFKASVDGMVKTLGGKNAWREFQAYARSDPNYDALRKANLLPKSEEAYPASIPEKIPILGKLAKSTQVGYEIMAQMMRVDSYGQILKGAEKAGVDINDTKFRTDLGKFIGTLTNRGSVGKLEPAANVINAFLFSPRALASTVHLATDWARMDYDPYIRAQATKAVISTGLVIAGTMALADSIMPGSVELDPRSSNFGKVKVGDTTFDISGGMSSLATLAARLYTGTTKSSSTNVVSSLTSGAYGSPTRMDELVNFFSDKAAPAVSTIIAQLKGEQASGEKTTVKNQIEGAGVPLGIETGMNAEADKNPKDPNAIVTMLLDDLGLSASVNNPATEEKTLSKTDQAMQKQIGKKGFTEYQNQYNSSLNTFRTSGYYKSLSPADQATATTHAESRIKDNLYKKYGFKAPKSINAVLDNKVNAMVP